MWDIPELTTNVKILIRAPLVFQKKLCFFKKIERFLKIMPIFLAVSDMEVKVRIGLKYD